MASSPLQRKTKSLGAILPKGEVRSANAKAKTTCESDDDSDSDDEFFDASSSPPAPPKLLPKKKSLSFGNDGSIIAAKAASRTPTSRDEAPFSPSSTEKEMEFRRREETLGPLHLKTLAAKLSCARSLGRERLNEAIQMAEEAGTGFGDLVGEHHPRSLAAKQVLASLLDERGDLRQACALYTEVVAGRASGMGDSSSSETCSAKLGLAGTLARLGEATKALKIYAHVAGVFSGRFGGDHARTLVVVYNQAVLLQQEGSSTSLAQARLAFSRVVNGRTKNLGPAHPDTVRSLASLSALLCEMRETDAAILCYRRLVRAHAAAASGGNTSMSKVLSAMLSLGLLLLAKSKELDGDKHGYFEYNDDDCRGGNGGGSDGGESGESGGESGGERGGSGGGESATDFLRVAEDEATIVAAEDEAKRLFERVVGASLAGTPSSRTSTTAAAQSRAIAAKGGLAKVFLRRSHRRLRKKSDAANRQLSSDGDAEDKKEGATEGNEQESDCDDEDDDDDGEYAGGGGQDVWPFEEEAAAEEEEARVRALCEEVVCARLVSFGPTHSRTVVAKADLAASLLLRWRAVRIDRREERARSARAKKRSSPNSNLNSRTRARMEKAAMHDDVGASAAREAREARLLLEEVLAAALSMPSDDLAESVGGGAGAFGGASSWEQELAPGSAQAALASHLKALARDAQDSATDLYEQAADLTRRCRTF